MTDLISSTLGNTIVGIVFLSLAASLTFLMFYAWKFPFDHEKLKSSAPPRVINLHRLLGYLFVIIYIYIMWNMVGNGLEASDKDLNTIIHYLTITYTGESGMEQPVSEESLPNRGMELYSERLCISCHGPAGKSPVSPTFPVLAGQSREYLIQQFGDIQSGNRKNGSAQTMNAMVQNVSAEEIAQIADYLSGQL